MGAYEKVAFSSYPRCERLIDVKWILRKRRIISQMSQFVVGLMTTRITHNDPVCTTLLKKPGITYSRR